MLDRNRVNALYHTLVNDLGLTAKEVVLEAGSALVAMGVRETTDDLDVSIPAEVFERLRRDYPVKLFGGVEVMPFNEYVDLHVYKGDWSTNFMTVEGVAVPAIEAQIHLKKTLMNSPERTEAKRERDKIDLAGLTAMLVLKTVVRGM